MRENEFLRWIAEHTPGHGRVVLGVGDDMAAVKVPTGVGLLKIDQCLDGVHFDLREHSAAQAGRKGVNRCLSDCAGMGCLATAILLSVALPREGAGSGEDFAKELFAACREAAAKFDCPIVGGDTAVWDGRMALTVAALGEVAAGGRMITRSGAKVGDTLFVSGALGGSILGRHLTFEPRIGLAQKLVKALGARLHAMMDLSDGLAQDLPRMCAASGVGGVGAEVHTGRLPIHADAERLAGKDGIPAGLHALADGEDYELLFAVDPEGVPELVGIDEVPVTAIGVVTAGKELRLIDEGSKSHPWPRGGWEHG